MLDIEKLRKERNMNQDELALLVGISRQAISSIERGVAKPSVENAIKLGEIFDIDWTKFYVKD